MPPRRTRHSPTRGSPRRGERHAPEERDLRHGRPGYVSFADSRGSRHYDPRPAPTETGPHRSSIIFHDHNDRRERTGDHTEAYETYEAAAEALDHEEERNIKLAKEKSLGRDRDDVEGDQRRREREDLARRREREAEKELGVLRKERDDLKAQNSARKDKDRSTGGAEIRFEDRPGGRGSGRVYEREVGESSRWQREKRPDERMRRSRSSPGPGAEIVRDDGEYRMSGGRGYESDESGDGGERLILRDN